MVASHLMQFNLVVLGTNKPRTKEITKANIFMVAECGCLRSSDVPRDQEPEPPPPPDQAVWILRSGTTSHGYHQDPVVA